MGYSNDSGAAGVSVLPNGYRSKPGQDTTTNNMILGYSGNNIASDVSAATVSGGGNLHHENIIGGSTANVGSDTVSNVADLVGSGAHYAHIGGGYDNVVNGLASAINTGMHCKIEQAATHGTISGGSFHSITTGDYGTIAGGTANTVSANSASIGGGSTNTASGVYAVVNGGSSNTASQTSATIGGGQSNTASAIGATVVGGRDNIASGTYSSAVGRNATASMDGQHAMANGMFVVQGDAQASRFVLRCQTTDAAQKLIGLGGVATSPQMSADTTWFFTYRVVARRTDVDGDCAAYKLEGIITKGATGSASFAGTPIKTVIQESSGAITWDINFVAGTSSLNIYGIGEAVKTINWVAYLELVEVTG